ncbi:transmembrane protein 236 [Dromiciops gliroides]|uniref:transmembrane protein 236 n=1 Tax=Dromiciops gliroides TaxID=33562 RepID=UPI001CC781BE|nr:transmembrane protein 236 [Dromiciops gliroides]
MVSGKLIKLLVYEILEFVSFSAPTIVVAEQFASAYQRTKNVTEKTYYWLVVSISIAYVALLALVLWVPVKVLLHKKHRLCSKIKLWRPPLMICIIFTTLPCFGFSIAVTEIQKSASNSSTSSLPDTLPDLPVSLVLGSLIIVDIIEKLRKYPLKGKPIKNEDWHIHTTNLQQMKTVSEQVEPSEENNSVSEPARRNPMPKPRTCSQNPRPISTIADETPFNSGVLRAISHQDKRAAIFLSSFIMWSDTIEMLRVSGHSAVFKSGWLYPVYIFSYISLLRIALTPQKSLVNSAGVFLQDFPFIFVRIGLIAVLGTITPILGLLKNILVTLSYFYFNYFTTFRVFNTNETSF